MISCLLAVPLGVSLGAFTLLHSLPLSLFLHSLAPTRTLLHTHTHAHRKGTVSILCSTDETH